MSKRGRPRKEAPDFGIEEAEETIATPIRKLVSIVPYSDALFGLCDDGTLWLGTWKGNLKRSFLDWKLLSGQISQTEEVPPPSLL